MTVPADGLNPDNRPDTDRDVERPVRGDRPSAQRGRWLYLVPVAFLFAAGWSYRSERASGAEVESADAIGFPLESATDPADPRRYIVLDNGLIEDAATGIRLPAQPGKTPAEVFAAEDLGEGRAVALTDPSGVNDAQSSAATGETPVDAPLASSSGAGNWTANSVQRAGVSRIGPPADLRYGIGPRPSTLLVDAIGVRSEVVPIGIDASRALQVPRRADIVGWWSGGSVPGEVGPTVLVGHYDSKVAAGVFSRLKQLTIGDLIVVSQSDGSRYTYFVTEVEHLTKTSFPTAKVYGRTAASTIRLVTCGGKFDRRTGHYVENTIVYADLWSSTPSPWTSSSLFPANPSSDSVPTSMSPVTADVASRTGYSSTLPLNPQIAAPVVATPSTTSVPAASTTKSGRPNVGSVPPSLRASAGSSVPVPTVVSSTVPVTTVPATNAPVTNAPVTNAPVTNATATSVPTSSPATLPPSVPAALPSTSPDGGFGVGLAPPTTSSPFVGP